METSSWSQALLPLLVVTLLLAAMAIAGYRAGRRSGRMNEAQLQGRCDILTQQLQARGSLDSTLQPLERALSDLAMQVQTAERARAGQMSGLSERMLSVGREVTEVTRDVGQQAQRITQALSRTHRQGSWGEMQLRRLVEASGMLSHVHFVEQTTVTEADRWLRPDMIIDLGYDRKVVVDAKVSLDAFLDPALSDEARSEQHACAVADHVTRLSGKQYHRAVGTPEFVIMFLPAEHLLSVALEARPDLLQSSFDRKVVLATPTTLMATLRSISWAWQQAEMADQAREVLEAGQQVAQRLSTMTAHLTKVGKSLDDAVDGYNRLIGSLESRVMPAARRLERLVAVEESLDELPEIDVRTRPVATARPTPVADALDDTG